MQQRRYPFLGRLGVLLSAALIIGAIYMEPIWGPFAAAGLAIGGFVATFAVLVAIQIGLGVRTSLEPAPEPRPRWTRTRALKAYGFVTGVAADIAGLYVATAMSSSVRGTLVSIVIAALVIDVPMLVFMETFVFLASLMDRARNDEAKGVLGLGSMTFFALGLGWMVAALVVANATVSGFTISGFWSYIGTAALIAAALILVDLPRRVWSARLPR
jgi:hypothetical protein